MKEAGDGLHAQMNSMMGALQELKLLQVQTALENLDIAGRPVNRGLPLPSQPAPLEAPATSKQDHVSSLGATMLSEASPDPVPSPRPSVRSMDTFERSLSRNRSSLETLSSSESSLGSETDGSSGRNGHDLESVPRRWSGYAAPQVDFCGPKVGNPPQHLYPQPQAPRRTQVVDLPGILYNLSKEGPSLDSDYSQESADDGGGSDWTSSLMSCSRNRQPLVLGDNIFADLVGNWLDLPEVERDETEAAVGEARRRKGRKEDGADGVGESPESPAHPLRPSRSQEICRKFSLTANIFKKFLRSVRPDRDKLLKERPGWTVPEQPEGDLFKRPKKLTPKNSKGSFYLPFWANGPQAARGRPCPHVSQAERNHQQCFPQVCQQPFAGIYLDRRQRPPTAPEKMPPFFDYNTAVWV